MKSKKMIIHWVNGQFDAWCPHLKGEHSYWRCPERIDQIDHWAGALKDAIRFTKYDGKILEVVLAHPQLTHQLVEAPPIKGMMLQRFLKRQVDKLKTFQGNAAWAWQQGRPIIELPNKEQYTATVHFMPEEIVKGLTAVAEKYELHLQRMVPLTEVLLHSRQKIEADANQIILMAASAGKNTMVIVAEKSGPIYVVRTLKSHWKDQPDQLATDINRTMLYIQQTFGVGVSGVWMMGVSGETQELLTPLVHSPLHFFGDEEHQDAWMRSSNLLHGKSIPNLINSSILRAPKLRMLTRVAAVITGMLTLSAMLIGSGVEYVLYQAQKRIDTLEPKLAKLRDRESQLTTIQDEINKKRAIANSLATENNQNAPHWLLAYLGEAVPIELQITDCTIEKSASGWEVDLSGVYHGSYQSDQNTSMQDVLSGFKSELETGPFHFNLESTNQEKNPPLKENLNDTKGHWMKGLSRAKQFVRTSGSTNLFQLKGLIQ